MNNELKGDSAFLRAGSAEDEHYSVGPGRSHPLGATMCCDGVNFSVFSRNCSSMELLLFNDPGASRPSRIITLDPALNRTCNYWHVFVADLKPGQLYGFRAHGPFDPQRGFRFDPGKVLLDPYGKAVAVPGGYSRHAAGMPGENSAT